MKFRAEREKWRHERGQTVSQENTTDQSHAAPLLVSDAFRELRAAWFRAHLASYAHEREWETEEHAEAREIRNQSLKAQFDADTESIIIGNPRPVCPRCENDLSGNHEVEARPLLNSS